MTTKELLAICKRRGLSITVKDGQPVIVAPTDRSAVTDKLLAVLKRHRERIIETLGK